MIRLGFKKSGNYGNSDRLSLNLILLLQINEVKEWGNRAGLGGVNDPYVPGFVNSVDMLELLSQKYLLNGASRTNKDLASLKKRFDKKLKILSESRRLKDSVKKRLILKLMFSVAKEKFRILMRAISQKADGASVIDEI